LLATRSRRSLRSKASTRIDPNGEYDFSHNDGSDKFGVVIKNTFGSGSQNRENWKDDDDCPEDAGAFSCVDLGRPTFNRYDIREHIICMKVSILFHSGRDAFN
jgi:hypothetical protein